MFKPSLALTVVLVSTTLSADGPIELPDSIAGRRLRAFFDAYAAGTDEAIRELEREHRAPGAIDIETREPRHFEELAEIQVIDPRYSPDGKKLLAIVEDHGEQNLVAVNIVDGSITRLVNGEDTVIEFDVGSNGEIFLLLTRPQLPAELFALTDGELAQLSTINNKIMDNLNTGRIEKFSYKSSDGAPMEGFVTFPPNYKRGKKYPGLLMIHGGPQDQYDYRFDFEAQLLAAEGYVIVMPNPRGSWGYGQAFSTAIYQDWGGIDYEDVIA